MHILIDFWQTNKTVIDYKLNRHKSDSNNVDRSSLVKMTDMSYELGLT